MKTITHTDGNEYVLKSDVETLVRDRTSKTSERARAAEARLQEVQAQIQDQADKIKGVDALHSQIASLQDDLQASNQRYSQHTTIAQHGITDASIRDTIVWSYERQMSKLPKKDRIGLDEWVTNIKQDPSQAPGVLQPHFVSQAPKTSQPAALQQTDRAQLQQLGSTQPTPTTNNGVQQVPNSESTRDLLSRASDREFYKANREKIREAWYKSTGRGPFSF